ncbi:MAG TPA: hypothetical protein PK987_06725, partial [Ferruginibacter sp.]|nr:hypothetical protein [Ferruginibacter sp.]
MLKKNMIWISSGFILVFILLNVAFIKIANTEIEKVFFGLLTAMVFSALTVYFLRRKKQDTK